MSTGSDISAQTPSPLVAPGDGLRSLVVRGIGWKVASQIVLQLSRLVVGVTLARLLSPHDYGLAGMVLAFSGLVVILADLALGSALVQRRTLAEADRSTVFWTGTFAGLVFTLLGIAAAGPIAAFYGEPEVAPLFVALSFSFLITSLGTTQRALLMRDMNFRGLEVRLIAGSLAGGVAGIAAAASGFGPWAIIVQQLVIATLSSVLLWRFSSWRPSWKYSFQSLRTLGGFSVNVFGTRVLHGLYMAAGPMVIGRFLGAAAVGVYGLAYTVIFLPFSQIAIPIGEVVFPAFSRMQDDRARLAASWVRATRLVAAIVMPSLLGLIVVAPDFVDIVLGERWQPAVPVIQILASVALIQALQIQNSSILMALDRTHVLLRYFVIFLTAHLLALAAGVNWGIVGVATAYAATALVVEPFYNWLTTRALGAPPWIMVRGLSGVTQAAMAMVACILIVKLTLLADASSGSKLVLLTMLGAAVYVPALALRAPEVIDELRLARGGGAAS